MASMFASIPQPVTYAEQICAHYASLSEARDSDAAARLLVQALNDLCGCAAVMVFRPDPAGTRLHLVAHSVDGTPRPCPVPDVDYMAYRPLRFSVEQNRMLSFDTHDASHDSRFLPASEPGLRSVLCQPLSGPDGRVIGVLVCATTSVQTLDMFVPSLSALGAFALAQMRNLDSMRSSASKAGGAARGERTEPEYGFIGSSPAMLHTRRLIGKVLDTAHTILLTGETGTGKEVVSRAVHDYGPRRSKAFVVQNCAAFPETLLESELFGHRKGAFTGADHDRPGLFETADGGTLLLDEIGDMPLSLQAKLLRVLQEGEVRPLGSNVTRKVNVRIIAATHRDLPSMIAEGQFRADLYYRLAHFPIELPALRERGEDVLTLARHFADRACLSMNHAPLRWADEALDALSVYSFPGNVRELKSMVERAVLMCEGAELRLEDFTIPAKPLDGRGVLTFRERMDAFERDMLLQSLRNAGGNRSLAARRLGLARRTLLYRMTHLNITGASPRAGG
jgi:sigma-54-dependent transcriptional regulator